jgi:hypothetical protein
MSIRCLFGFHDWGRQRNIREQKHSDGAALAYFLFPLLLFLGPPRECDRECLSCGKTKVFPYDPAR